MYNRITRNAGIENDVAFFLNYALFSIQIIRGRVGARVLDGGTSLLTGGEGRTSNQSKRQYLNCRAVAYQIRHPRL